MMERKSTRSKKLVKQKKTNFNFSDDSGDDFDTPHILNRVKKEKEENNHGEHNISSIISSNFSCGKLRLSSLAEDIGLPMMDSTHMIMESNAVQRSVCGDITNETSSNVQMKGDNCELQAGNTYAACKEDFEKKNAKCNGMNVEGGKENASSDEPIVTNSTSLQSSSLDSQLSSEEFLKPDLKGKSCLPNMHTSLLSNQPACMPNHGSECVNKLMEGSSTMSGSLPSSQEAFSYYVQDVSVQTSLPYDKLSSSSAQFSKTEYLNLSHESDVSKSGILSKNPQCLHVDKLPLLSSPLSGTRSHDINQHLRLFEDSGSVRESSVGILAADSDSDGCSDKYEYAQQQAVVADSEDENNENCSLETGLAGMQDVGKEKPFAERSDKVLLSESCKPESPQSRESCISDIYMSAGSTKDGGDLKGNTYASDGVESITSSFKSLSFHQREQTSRQRRISSSSDDDDQFENFLSKLKSDVSAKSNSQRHHNPSLKDFIVDSDESESDADDKGDSEEEALFFIKTTNELEKSKNRNERRLVEKTYSYPSSSCSGSDSQPDSDSSGFIVDDCKDKANIHSKDSSNYRSTGSAKVAEAKGMSGSSKTKPYKSPQNRKHIPSTGKQRSEMAVTGCTTFSSDSDDDFITNDKVTPSKWKSSTALPFKTPKQISKSTTFFETPARQTVPQVHPWTAPKACKPSNSTFEDDNTFFLKSLSSDYSGCKRHPEAARYIKNFKTLKQELTSRLFTVFNETVFESRIPPTLTLEWNARYTKTAGTFSYKGRDPNYTTKITLSTKVCDSPERVRDTLVHELCHAAVKLINGINESHGRVWKSWARKVNTAFPFMPVVARCHDYMIQTKYTYQCVNCKYRIGRHSKSLDTERKVCGHCKGEFQVFLTSELNSSDSSSAATPKTPRTPNKFALFVKECYSEVKKRNINLKHGDIMKELSKEFAEKNKI